MDRLKDEFDRWQIQIKFLSDELEQVIVFNNMWDKSLII